MCNFAPKVGMKMCDFTQKVGMKMCDSAQKVGMKMCFIIVKDILPIHKSYVILQRNPTQKQRTTVF